MNRSQQRHRCERLAQAARRTVGGDDQKHLRLEIASISAQARASSSTTRILPISVGGERSFPFAAGKPPAKAAWEGDGAPRWSTGIPPLDLRAWREVPPPNQNAFLISLNFRRKCAQYRVLEPIYNLQDKAVQQPVTLHASASVSRQVERASIELRPSRQEIS
jgi:hypothetical protein